MTPTHDHRRIALVTFESTSRSTAAGNHIEAVRLALESAAQVVVCGSERQRLGGRYAAVAWRWLRSSRRGDLAYVRNHPASIVVVALARLRGQRVVLEVNGPPEDIGGVHARFAALVPLLRRFLRWSITLSDSVVVPTPGMRDHLETTGPTRPVAVIPAGYDERVFHPSSEPDAHAPYVVFIGANTAWQGVEVLLEATRCAAWPADVGLTLVGSFGEEFVAGARSGPVHIELAGVLQPAQVAATLRGALASVSPKTYQGGAGPRTGQAPLKVYEALGCGVPCIVSDVPLQNQLIAQHDCGLVVPSSDPDAIARAVQTYRTDAALRERHARNAVAASEQFSWTALAAATRAFVLGTP